MMSQLDLHRLLRLSCVTCTITGIAKNCPKICAIDFFFLKYWIQFWYAKEGHLLVWHYKSNHIKELVWRNWIIFDWFIKQKVWYVFGQNSSKLSTVHGCTLCYPRELINLLIYFFIILGKFTTNKISSEMLPTFWVKKKVIYCSSKNSLGSGGIRTRAYE